MPAPTEPTRVSRGVVRRGFVILGRAIREEPRIFAAAVAGSALYGLMTVASSVVLGRVTERVVLPELRTGRVDAGLLTTAAVAIGAVGLVKAVGVVGRRLAAGVMQYRLQASYRRRVTHRYLALPLSWHQRNPTGRLLSNANADVEASWYPLAPLPFAAGVLVMLLVTLGLLIATDPVLALVGGVVFPAVGALSVYYSRRISPITTRAQQLRAEVSAVAHESFDGALVVKTLGREASETERFARAAYELRDANIRVGRVRGAFDPVMDALPSLGVLVVLLVGSARVSSGAMDTGDLVQVAYLFVLLSFPIRAIGWLLAEIPRSVVGYDRVARVLSATGETAYGTGRLDREPVPARVSLEGAGYAYGDGPPVLTDVTLRIVPGRTVAVVGPTGAGKSTLAGLLVRLTDPTAGVVRIDGADLRTLAAGEVPAAAAYVSQQTFLFDDTVRGNVTLGLEVTDDQVWAALALARADGFVRALPRGLDTLVGERGTTLSGGQRQRVALARALVRTPRLLVLDDATSSVDPTVEAAILAGLRTGPPATVVLVAYRQATIGLADEVVYLDGGRLVDRGTHAELLGRTPGYARVVTAYERAEAA